MPVTLNLRLPVEALRKLKQKKGKEFSLDILARKPNIKSMHRKIIPCVVQVDRIVVQLVKGDGWTYQDVHRMLKQELL